MDGIQPAQLSFLTIYNPLLGTTDETTHDQILYYYASRAGRTRRAHQHSALSAEGLQNEERNEQMRQVGLAQGMVNLARDLAQGQTVDYVDTEKARIFMIELESNWWLLASVDLTRIEVTTTSDKTKEDKDQPAKKVEYSTRELCPQPLLRQHVLRAHSIFLLHHGSSLTDIMARRGRPALTVILERFWSRFIRYWDVLMHGSPAVDIFDSLKLAAGGELGFGVGEEDWGSGERDVLEDLVARTDGLVDLVVSRFGDAPSERVQKYEEPPKIWIGTGAHPSESDGVIFSGVGAVPRIDIIRISAWMEWIFRFGIFAYGVQENPQSARRKRRRREVIDAEPPPDPQESLTEDREGASTTNGIPPPLIRADTQSRIHDDEALVNGGIQSYVDTDTIVKYMTLGIYGSSWGFPSGRPSPARSSSAGSQRKAPGSKSASIKGSTTASVDSGALGEQARREARRHPDVIRGCFLIGLTGDLDETPDSDSIGSGDEIAISPDAGAVSEGSSYSFGNEARRIPLRTVHMTQSSSVELPFLPSTARLRVVIYAKQPFMYTFLFDANNQPGLAFPSFYRKLHDLFAPLEKSLLRTTDPASVRRRLAEAASNCGVQAGLAHPNNPIYDLIFDPANGTCRTSLPGIPDISESLGIAQPSQRKASSARTTSGAHSPSTSPPWSRADALAVHSLIVRIWQDTRKRPRELERTVRSARGWWIVWMRLSTDTATLEGANEAAAASKVNREQKAVDDQIIKTAKARDNAGRRLDEAEEARTLAEGKDVEPDKDAGDDRSAKPIGTASAAIGQDDQNSSSEHVTEGGDDRDTLNPTRAYTSDLSRSNSTSTVTESGTTHQLRKQEDVCMMREAFLIRRAAEKNGRASGVGAGVGGIGSNGDRKASGGGGGGGFFSGFNVGYTGGKKEDDGQQASSGSASRLAEGIGIDTRKYVESLLSLNR